MPTDASLAAPGDIAQSAPVRTAARAPLTVGRLKHWLVDGSFAILIVCSAVSVLKPSPYDFASIVAILLYFVSGFRLHWSFVTLPALLLVYNLGGFISLVPYWNEEDPVTFMIQSIYLVITAMYFTAYFGEQSNARAKLCLEAYTIASLISSITAIMGYFDIAGTSVYFMNWDRAAGTHADPNVLGSFVIVGILYPLRLIMLGETRRVALTTLVMLINVAGCFLSYSRGSYLALVFTLAMMIALAIATTRGARLRRRIIGIVLGMLAIVVIASAALLSNETIRETLDNRLQGVGTAYEDPRFDNQQRSLPFLLTHPLGYGPLRFRNTFDLEPHSSFVNGFASYGWLGGYAFILLVGASIAVGLRLSLVYSPFRAMAQVMTAAMTGFLLQGFQIDIDHWRHVYLLMAAVWGLETARLRWRENLSRQTAVQNAVQAAARASTSR
jgi:hypothetical protein